MARTPTVSDEVILEAAQLVMRQRGVDAFTLSEVAEAVGLSRAAIILRFNSTQALKMTLLTQMVNRFVKLLNEELPVLPPGGDSLLAIAAFLGKYANSRESSASFWSVHHSNLKDPDLAELEIKRGTALRAAIARAMPETRIPHAAAVAAFNVHIAGTLLTMITEESVEPKEFLLQRTRDWLRLAGIPFTESVGAAVGRRNKSRAEA